MTQSRRTPRRLCRWALLTALLFLLGGQAGFAYWYPTYSDGEYMGCTYEPGPFEGGNAATVSPNVISRFGCWMLMLNVSGRSVAENPPAPAPSGQSFKDADDFARSFGLTSDDAVRTTTAVGAAEMRKEAQRLQAAALELTRAAQATESLTTKEELKTWLTKWLNPPADPVCGPAPNP